MASRQLVRAAILWIAVCNVGLVSGETSEETFRRQGKVLSIDGAEIAYAVEGRGEPALVLVHGWTCDQSFWSGQVGAFSADRAVVTLDLGGHGKSSAERAEHRIATFGHDVRAVIEALGFERVILVGHSLGGPAVLEAAKLMPERLVGVVGVDTFHDAERKQDPQRRQRVIAAYAADFPRHCEQFVRSGFPEGAEAVLVGSVVRRMCDASAEMAVDLMRDVTDYDLAADLSRVSAPIVSINSDRTPTATDTNRKYDPDFEVVLMSGVGHFLMMERPGEFNDILARVIADFERRHEGREE